MKAVFGALLLSSIAMAGCASAASTGVEPSTAVATHPEMVAIDFYSGGLQPTGPVACICIRG